MPISPPTIVLRQVKGSELTYSEVDGNFDNLKTSIVSVASQVDTNKSISDANYSALESRVTETEQDIVVLETNVANNTTNISGHETRIDVLEADVVSINGDITDVNTRIDNLETAVNSTLGDHENRIDLLETDVSDHENRISVIETDLSAALVDIDTNTISIQSLDGRISIIENNITSPFLYKGTISAGTDLAPFLISSITPTPAAGNYYRVILAGYIQDSEKTVFVNVGDGILFKDASTVDVIDNTDPTISGQTDYIDVTGNADEGYTISFATAAKTTIDSVAVINTRLTTAEGDIGSLDTRVGTAEGDIGSLEMRMTSAEGNITSLIDPVTGRVTVAENDIDSLETRVTILETSSGGGVITYTATTTTVDQVADTVPSTADCAKYIMFCTDGTDTHASELLVMKNGTNAYINEYGKILSTVGNDLATFSADINSGSIRLLVTPTNANTNFKLIRTAM